MRIEGNTASLGVSTVLLASSGLLTATVAVIAHAIYPLVAAVAMSLTAILTALVSIQLLNRIAHCFPSYIGKIIHWIHAMAFEGFAILAAAFLHPMRYLTSHTISHGTTSGRPILLVHGYLHDCSGWIYQRRRLCAAGFGPIYMLNLGAPFLSIRQYAEKIGQMASEIERETGRSDLILIGHSMGGLVSSWYATRVAPPGKVTDVITIGSPLAGTIVARIGIGPNAREMERDSGLVKELQKEIAASRQIRFYQIATRTDQLVIPHISAFVGNHPDRQYLIEDIGHVSLLFSSRVAKKIRDWLRVS